MIPDTIAARTLTVLIIGLMISHALSVALYLTDRSNVLMFAEGAHGGEHMATIAEFVEAARPDERQGIVAVVDSPMLHVIWSQESAIEDRQDDNGQAGPLRKALATYLDDAGQQVFRVRQTDVIAAELWQRHLGQEHPQEDPDEMLLVSLQLSDATWLNFAAPVTVPSAVEAPIWSLRFVLSLLVMLLTVGIASAVVVRHLTKPLARFSRAAERLGTDVNSPPMPEDGPAEVRQATRAFNQMQRRVRRYVEDRTQMLAAISHDLGTPITRLRLRAEFIEDEEQRIKTLADLDDMEKMVSSALSFARDDAANEPHVTVDLRSLLHRVCDAIADTGQEVTLDAGEAPVRFGCRPVALRRALTNLIDNAVKYGDRARVSLQTDENTALIRIDDDGPGIPPELREDAFRPFHRLETSRSRETGGTGLGLSVARTIIRAHGGDILLTNRDQGGLRIEIRLPR